MLIRRCWGSLDIGEAVAKIQGRWHKPFHDEYSSYSDYEGFC